MTVNGRIRVSRSVGKLAQATGCSDHGARREGVPDRFGLPDHLVCTLPLSAHKPAGALSARHSLRPLLQEGH